MDHLLHTLPCGFLSFADDGVVTQTNTTLLEWLGLAPSEVQGRHVESLLTLGGRIFYQTHVFPLLKLQGWVNEIYLTLRSSSGEILPVLVNGVRRERAGSFANDWIIVIVRERTRYEEELLRAKKAAEEAIRVRDHAQRTALEMQKLESMSVLAGGIAHDFNNLLTSVLSNVDLALLDLAPTDPAYQSVVEIQHAAERAAKLTAQMLAYSGRGRFVAGVVDLCSLFQNMQLPLRAAVSKDIHIDYQLGSQPLFVEGDAAQLQQAITNLVINAAEALHGRKGCITLGLNVCELSQAELSECYLSPDLPVGKYVALEVADTGAGMDATTREKMFEPFFTTKFAGRGLGMPAVLGIVRAHDGAIQVTSAPGCGTTVRLLLPHVR